MTSVPTNQQPITIGVDPHPQTHTASALDMNGKPLSAITISSDGDGAERLLAWAEQFTSRRWAVEGAGNSYVEPLIAELSSRGESVFNITPSLTAQYRRIRGGNKNDVIDATNTARALLANPETSCYHRSGQQRELQEATRAYRRVSVQLKAQRMTLKECRSGNVQEALRTTIVALEASSAQLRSLMEQLVKEVHPELLMVLGIGPIVGAVILAEVGSVTRFASRDQFASFGGLAPIQRLSGSSGGVRVNSGGNRRLNWAVHMMVKSRLGCCERSRAYVERKMAEGKTRRAAIRCLKTLAAREVYGVLKRSRVTSAAAGA